jgi:hypothetical protein
VCDKATAGGDAVASHMENFNLVQILYVLPACCKTSVMLTLKETPTCPRWPPAMTNSLGVNLVNYQHNWLLRQTCLPWAPTTGTPTTTRPPIRAMMASECLLIFTRNFDSCCESASVRSSKKPRGCGACVCVNHLNRCKTCTFRFSFHL